VTNSLPRFVATLLLLASAALFLRARDFDLPPPTPGHLPDFPGQLGPWDGTDQPIDPRTLEILGPGEFLMRNYFPHPDQDPWVNLFIAYFPSQRAGDTIHSPLHCLPGAGWLPIDRSQVTVSLRGHDPFPANRVVIAKGELRQVVLYWYWAHDRGVASEYWAKYYLIKDSIQLHRSDGSLIRIITPMYPGESADAAYQRLLPFAGEIVPRLDDYIPR
jgi:EpsI family protein